MASLDISFEVKKCLCFLMINYLYNVSHKFGAEHGIDGI